MEFRRKQEFGIANNLALGYHQILPYLTLTYHSPYEVIQSCDFGAI